MVPKNRMLTHTLMVSSFNPHMYKMASDIAKQIKKLISVIRQKLTILFKVLSVLFINLLQN